MTDKGKNGLGPGRIEIDGERYGSYTFEHDGTRYTVRELSVDEGDDAAEAATDDKGKINERMNTRLLLAKSLVEPPTTAERLGKFGNQKYLTVLRHFNTLNSIQPANPTPPAGSAGPTSPAGGEPSPQP